MRRNLWLLAAPSALFIILALSLYLGKDSFDRLSLSWSTETNDAPVLKAPIVDAQWPSDTTSASVPSLTQTTDFTRSTHISTSVIETDSWIFTPFAVATETPSSTPTVKAVDSATPTPSAESEKQDEYVVQNGTETALLYDWVETNRLGTVLSASEIATYVDSIMTDESVHPLLACPELNFTRYSVLQSNPTSSDIEFFFAINLRNTLGLLPTLIGSIVEAMHFLGPRRCALSIVEGNSPDGTADVLAALQRSMEELGARYFFSSSDVNPTKGDRIKKLAELRNLALEPLVDHANHTASTATVVFLNDVAICAEDILELVYQRRVLGADMTCAMDWTYLGPDPTFYDVWISRQMNGDSFFRIPLDGSWELSGNLFWNNEISQSRFQEHRPFQVFSCWNGAVTFGAQPILDGLRFRSSREGECYQGEPTLFCKDLWFQGHGKIAVVPSVNLEYTVDNGKRLKENKGYTSDVVENQSPAEDKIDWFLEPPEKIKCMLGWGNQFFEAWNKTLTRDR